MTARAILLCVPVSRMGAPNDPTSTRRLADCGHDVWVSSYSDGVILEHDPLIVCDECRPPRGTVQIMGPTPEQRVALHALGVSDRDIRRILRKVRRE